MKRNDELEAILLQLWPTSEKSSTPQLFGRYRESHYIFCEVSAGQGGAQKRLLRRNFSRHLMKPEDARKGNMN